MVYDVVQTVRSIARNEDRKRPNAAIGLVTSLHGTEAAAWSHACTVRLRETGLVLPKVPIATGLTGVAALPRENDTVIVLFVGGDLHAPVIVGRLYNEEVSPPEHDVGQLVAWLPGDASDETKQLRFKVDTPGDGSRAAELVLAGDVRIEIRIDDEGIVIRVGDASLSLTQSSASDGAALIEVGASSVEVTRSGDVTIIAEGKLMLKANQVEISGDTAVKIAGQMIDLN